MSANAPDITLYFLAGSRAIRIAWLLEELGLSYKLIASPRASNGHAPPDFKAQIPTILGNSPTIQDGDLVIQESGAITEYLCEVYDTSSRLIPKDIRNRVKVREWIAAAEGNFLLHGVVILYTRMQMPQGASQYLPALEETFSSNVRNALDWLDSELKNSISNGKFLVGMDLTAADIMMGFSIEIIFKMKLGTERQKWPMIESWLRGLTEREAYKRAVAKTGYAL